MPVVMDADRIGRTLTRIAHEIVERNKGVEDLALVGVRTRGVHIARRLARALREITGQDIPTGALDITLYRDDLMRQAVGPQPLVRRTEIPFSIDNRKILLVDDVLYTVRTTRAALDALIDFGRPKANAMPVEAAAVTTTCSPPPSKTNLFISASRLTENSKPIENSRSITPISAKTSISSSLSINPSP